MKRLLLNLLPFMLLVLLLFGCSESGSAIEESGTIETTNVIISSQASGKVIKLSFDEGESVENGDTLAIIDYERAKYMLRQAEASVKISHARLSLLRNGARAEDIRQASAALSTAQANHNMLAADRKRMENLLSAGSVTQKQFDEVNTRYEAALAQLKSAEAQLSKMNNLTRPEEIEQAVGNLEAAEANLLLMKKNLDECFITSPLTGQLVKRFIEVGESVSPMAPVFKASNLSEAKLVIYVNEKDLGRVSLGQKAEVSVDSFEGRVFEGQVVYISPEAEFTPKNIQTKEERAKLVFAVKIKIPNPGLELKSGMPADAVLVSE